MTARYLAFAGEVYYPSGGMNDLSAKGNDLAEVISQVCENTGSGSSEYTWWHVVDLETMKIVAAGNAIPEEERKELVFADQCQLFRTFQTDPERPYASSWLFVEHWSAKP